VRLRRLELQGFKSFANRTSFDFGAGITAIVGPNGSGKSNLADALRWVLGEQNPRVLRLRRLEDVIYAGGGKRAQSGFAEVSITLDNTEGWLPLDFTEVVVTRRLHRSGESEYLLNRKRTRLRDIVDLFLKARLGQNSYAILGQGMVDTVLSLRPEERRTLIEEAADVRRYRLKIDEATDQLAATRDNRDRVELLLAEIAPRLVQLERQARRASEHAELSSALADAVQRFHVSRARAAIRALGAAREQYEVAVAGHGRAARDLSAVERKLEEAHAERASTAAELDEAQKTERACEEAERQASRELRETQERVAFLERRRTETERDLAALHDEAAALAAEMPSTISTDDELRENEAAIAAAEDSAAMIAGRLEEAKAALRERQDKHDLVRRLQLDLDAGSARRQRERDRLDADEAGLARRRAGAILRLRQWAKQYSVTVGEGPELERRLEGVETMAADAARRTRTVLTAAGEAERELSTIAEQIDATGRRLEAVEHELATRKPVQEVVVALLDALRGGGPGRPRVLGILGGLLHVQRGMEIAVEAALAESLNALVVRTERDALAAIGILRELEVGRLTFYVLEGQPAPHPLNLGDEKGVLGTASRFVRADEGYRDFFEALLGRIVVVEDLESARKVVRRGLGPAVTVDGTVFRPGGVVTGGSGKAEGYVFRSAGELEALRESITELERQRTAQQALLARLHEQAEEAGRREAGLREELGELLARAEHISLSLAARQRLLEPLRGELDWLRLAAGELAGRRLELEAEPVEHHVGADGSRMAELDAVSAALTVAQRTLQQALEEERLAVGRLAELRGSRNALLRDRDEVEAFRTSLIAARERTALLLSSREDSVLALAQEARETSARLDPAARRLAGCRLASEGSSEQLRLARARVEASNAAQQLLTDVVASARVAAATAERVMEDAQRDLTRAGEVLESLRAAARAEGLTCDLLAMGEDDASLADEVSPEVIDAEVMMLRGRIRGLGAVNEEAELDYRESKERHDFLTAQMSDLRDAEAGLVEALDQLRQIVRDQFRTIFQTINADFQVYFRAFFGGGNARLVLSEPEDYGESGVDIIAQPPGRRLQNLAMLSGGERSMTAVALLFALLESNPAPFCVLDEVDAALDESNVGRFSESLGKLAARGQFLVVTHNRGTVQAADTIYGVSMSADGTSNVLSMRLGEAAPMLA